MFMVHRNPVCHCISHDPYAFEPADREADRTLKALETRNRPSPAAETVPEIQGGDAVGHPSMEPRDVDESRDPAPSTGDNEELSRRFVLRSEFRTLDQMVACVGVNGVMVEERHWRHF